MNLSDSQTTDLTTGAVIVVIVLAVVGSLFLGKLSGDKIESLRIERGLCHVKNPSQQVWEWVPCEARK